MLLAGGAGAASLSNEENAYSHLYEQMDGYKNGSTLRLIQSYAGTSNNSDDSDYTAWVYDNDLALLALVERGTPEDISRAKIIADSLIWVQNHDQDFNDGRIRDGYWATSLNDTSGKNSSIKSPSSGTGNMAWTIIALLRYYDVTGDATYLNAAERLGNWINSSTYDGRGAGGYTGGYEGWDTKKIEWKSTEHNIDTYVAFSRLYTLTGNKSWDERAQHAKKFVEEMWNETEGHFWAGTELDGDTINKSTVPLDVNTWGLMAMGDKYKRGISWVESHSNVSADGFEGFDFNDDRDGIWFEGTAQMVVAYQILGDEAKANFYLNELRRAQTNATNANGKGIVAASHDNVTTGFGWNYSARLHIGATAWYIFAENRYNPLSKIWYVDDDRADFPQADFTRIQDAIDNASAGDMILVYSGMYYENVNVTRRMVLRGVDDGGGKPVVNANGNGSAITLSAGNSTLEGFAAINSTDNWPGAGIFLNSNNNTIRNNTASNNSKGIFLSFSNNNILSGNDASNNEEGIFLISSNNNILSDNNASNNYEACSCFPSGYGIHLSSSSNNNLSGNKVSNNNNGIFIGYSNNNTLNSNIALNNHDYGFPYSGYGIYLASSANNTLINNIMAVNKNNFEIDYRIDLSSESYFDNQIDTSNLVNGKPVYYIKGIANAVYDSSTSAGTFYCISCVNVTLKNMDLSTKNNTAGIFFWNTSLSNIQNITVSNNDIGIYLYFSSNNTLSGNNASSNRNTGIDIQYSTGNTLTANMASNNVNGISLHDSGNNTLTNNIMIGNKYNFGVYWDWYGSDFDSIFYNRIDITNLADGKPIYYVKSAINTVFDTHTGAGTFYCINCINVTVKNLDLNNNGAGIFFWNTTDSKIQNVNVLNNFVGIEMLRSNNNTLSGNNALNNYYGGIVLHYSGNNTININNASSNYGGGIRMYYSNNNTLTGNNATSNLFGGIDLFSSSNSTLTGNNALNNTRGTGIDLYDSNNNTLSGNNASNNRKGIAIEQSGNNYLTNNVMEGNKYNFGLSAFSSSDFDNQIDTSNLVNGKPVYYINGAANAVYDSTTDAGTFYCINCVNITVKDMDFKENDAGILFQNTTSSKIQKVNVFNNNIGIRLDHSSNNNLSGNSASNNSAGISLSFLNDNNAIYDNIVFNNSDEGIHVDGNYNSITGNRVSYNREGIILYGDYNVLINNSASENLNGINLEYSMSNILSGNNVFNNDAGIVLYPSSNSNNRIYYNNFINNFKNAFDTSQNNIWDSGYPGGGNYWSDYTGTDSNGDGIGDTPYNISGGAGAQDRYPFTTMNGWQIIPLPGMNLRPTDPDHDGIYEDLNGNGRKDFNDVVVFFNNLEWIPDHEPVSAFDFNGNGRIDFADIVRLFEEI